MKIILSRQLQLYTPFDVFVWDELRQEFEIVQTEEEYRKLTKFPEKSKFFRGHVQIKVHVRKVMPQGGQDEDETPLVY